VRMSPPTFRLAVLLQASTLSRVGMSPPTFCLAVLFQASTLSRVGISPPTFCLAVLFQASTLSRVGISPPTTDTGRAALPQEKHWLYGSSFISHINDAERPGGGERGIEEQCRNYGG
jgi:hypothetical protein